MHVRGIAEAAAFDWLARTSRAEGHSILAVAGRVLTDGARDG
jgi:AmiR/NasT family two-component response regulator